MLLFYIEPQKPVEMLSNAYRSPVEISILYEPNLRGAIIIKDYNTSEYANSFYDYTQSYVAFSHSTNTSALQVQDLLSDKISVCQFHVVEVH